MFRLGFSLVHLGYSLIFAMVLAGFLWDQPVYTSVRWRLGYFTYAVQQSRVEASTELFMSELARSVLRQGAKGKLPPPIPDRSRANHTS